MEKRTWSSENLKNILFSSAGYLGPLGLGYHFPKISRVIIPVTIGSNSVFSSLLTYHHNHSLFLYGLLYLTKCYFTHDSHLK